MGGSPSDLLETMAPCIQRRHTARGLVFALNYMFLLFVWMGAGYMYFGAIGLVCPGLIVPSILVLGLGRLIAMRHRPPAQEFENYPSDIALPSDSFSLAPRVFVALILSSVTTCLFMMNMSQDLIRKSAAAVATEANKPLLEDRLQNINITFDQKIELLKVREADLTANRDEQHTTYADAIADAAAADASREQAKREKEFERGGVGSRVRGPGSKYQAWQALEIHYSNVSEASNKRALAADEKARELDADILKVRQSRQEAEDARRRDIESAPIDVQKDPRYAVETKGLFSDATLFLALYSDPKEGPGMALITALCVAFLFIIELADLIAVLLSPCVASTIGYFTKMRLAISRLGAEAEIELARPYSEYSRRTRPDTATRTAAPAV